MPEFENEIDAKHQSIFSWKLDGSGRGAALRIGNDNSLDVEIESNFVRTKDWVIKS